MIFKATVMILCYYAKGLISAARIVAECAFISPIFVIFQREKFLFIL